MITVVEEEEAATMIAVEVVEDVLMIGTPGKAIPEEATQTDTIPGIPGHHQEMEVPETMPTGVAGNWYLSIRLCCVQLVKCKHVFPNPCLPSFCLMLHICLQQYKCVVFPLII